MAGHAHHYDCLLRNGIYYVTTGGGGAELSGPGGPWGTWRVKTFADWHFVQIDASLKELKIEVYDIDDVLRHAFTIAGDVIIPGDANDDGIVDDEDASILAAHWQQTGMSWEHGDFNDDGVVNNEDASILAAHWLESLEGSAAVPEPLGGVLLVTGLGAVVALAAMRRRPAGRAMELENGK